LFAVITATIPDQVAGTGMTLERCFLIGTGSSHARRSLDCGGKAVAADRGKTLAKLLLGMY